MHFNIQKQFFMMHVQSFYDPNKKPEILTT